MERHLLLQIEEEGDRRPLSRRRRVFIVDDHSVVRRGLATLINEQPDLEVCGDAENEQEAVGKFADQKPDLLLADWSLKQSDSSALISALTRNNPGLPVLVLSIHDEMTHAPAAVAAGARGYIMKREAAEKIIEGIQAVLEGKFYLGHRALAEISGTATARFLEGSRIATGGGYSSPPTPKEPEEPFVGWKLSVVIPVYNSERTVAKLCEQLELELRGAVHLEILLVDDGSLDGSVQACRQMTERFPNVVRTIELARNFGEHNAVMAGLNHATGDYCVIMDDDLQNPPSEVKKLLRTAARGFDAVYSRYPQRKHPFYRRAGSLVQDWTAGLLLGKPRGLYLSSFKALSASTVRAVSAFKGPKPYLDALILRATSKIGTVDCLHRRRTIGESSYTFRKLVGLWCRLGLGFSVWPIRALLGLGLAVCAFGFWVDPPSSGKAETSASGALWLYRALVLFTLGAVGEYIGWLLLLNRTPPQYVVRKLHGFPPREEGGGPDA
jgi:DNA-binding NarL/FixJ family response regulator/glycosyltransferase involved in cell wall biosynthesis